MNCLNCKMARAEEPEKCWNCGADRNGRISEKREKRTTQTRDLLRELDNEKSKCIHGIVRFHPCEKCGRDEPEVLESYRTSALKQIQEVLMDYGLVAGKAEAAIAARLIIAQIGLQK